jgi:hypothetical protein
MGTTDLGWHRGKASAKDASIIDTGNTSFQAGNGGGRDAARVTVRLNPIGRCISKYGLMASHRFGLLNIRAVGPQRCIARFRNDFRRRPKSACRSAL